MAVPLARERLELLGLVPSGAFGYYKARLDRGTIFGDYELAIAEALLHHPEWGRLVHEIGGGFGELSLLLSRLGFKTICLDYDDRRFHAAVALWEGLSSLHVDLKGNCKMVYAGFPMPPGELPPDGAIALITNLICTTPPELKAAIMIGLEAYPSAVVDIDRFLVECKTPDDRAERLEAFSTAGMKGELFLDLGKSAHFYRFTPKRLAGGETTIAGRRRNRGA